MSLARLEQLAPDAFAIAEKYLRDVDSTLRALDADMADATVEDLRSHLCEVLEPGASAEDVAAVVRELGDPREYADAAKPAVRSDDTEPAGRIFGIPYDFRATPARIAARWWNPGDPRILMPRVFGAGWDLNFGALAVKLHFIEPDAEDEPFGAVSDRAFLFALLVPVALTAFLVGTFLGSRLALPSTLPAHWTLSGAPDRYWSRGFAFGFLFAMAALPTLWAVWSVAAHRPPLARGAVIGLASFTAALAAGGWALTLAAVFAPPLNGAMLPLSILGAFLVPLAVFLGLARAGRAADMRRDLGMRSGGR